MTLWSCKIISYFRVDPHRVILGDPLLVRRLKRFSIPDEPDSCRPYHRSVGRRGASGEPGIVEIRSPGRKWRTGTGGWFGLFGDENRCKPSKVSIARELQDTFSWSNGDASGLSGCTKATLYAVKRSAVVGFMGERNNFLFSRRPTQGDFGRHIIGTASETVQHSRRTQ